MKCLALLLLTLVVDWPQWGGPDRDFSIDGKIGRLNRLQPLILEWEQAVSPAYAGLVVGHGMVFVHAREGQSENVTAFDQVGGTKRWAASYAAAAPDFFYQDMVMALIARRVSLSSL